MHALDWAVVVAYLVWVVRDGLRRSRSTGEVDGYLLANRSLPGWAVGLSVMATQLSAITLVGTTGQGYADGMRFVQFYLGLPVAMVVLSLTAVPLFWRARVYTAYEYLERRFDRRTRTLASVLFLLSRGLSCGVIVAAPAVILSILLGWDLTLTVLAIGLPTVLYTMVGGVQAVTWTDVKQMAVIVAGVLAAVGFLIAGLPSGVGAVPALRLAGAVGRLHALDFRLDPSATYTFWSGLVGGLFLMLSYFGCDQSQVQRYLTARSVDAGRRSLLMSAYVKIPLQALVLLTGVLVYVFYLFETPPMLFNPVHEAEVRAGARGGEYARLEAEFGRAVVARRESAREAARAAAGAAGAEAARRGLVEAEARVADVRTRATALVRETTGDARFGDVNYVFPTFVITRMPRGLVGLLVAAILAAAMSSIAAELNALATVTLVDLYRPWRGARASDARELLVSKVATGVWGLFACAAGRLAVGLGSLIEVVNRFGSFFYGSLLGVFVLAVAVRRANGRGAVVGLLAGMAAVACVARWTDVSFLWHNVVGVAAVVAVGTLASLTAAAPGAADGGGGEPRASMPGREEGSA